MSDAALNLSLRRRVPVVLQAEAAECGLACLTMVAVFHGLEVDLTSLRLKLSSSLRGVTLAQLMQMAAELRLSSRALRLEPVSLQQLTTPCVIHWNLDHFVVLERATSRHIWIVDPALGRRKLTIETASKSFTGVALEITPAEDFVKATAQTAIRIRHFFDGVVGLRGNLTKLFALSICLQVFALATPFYGQLVIDEAIAAGDMDLLFLLLCGFGLVVLLSISIGILRTFLVLTFGSRLQFAWASRLFHHLLRLPLGYFEKRHVADVLSRFRSLGPIQSLATTTIIEALMDGLMTVTTLIVMVMYGPALTAVSVVTLGLYALARLATYNIQREVAQEQIQSAVKESGHFLESLRGILAIKTFSREHMREGAWRNLAAEAIRTSFKASALGTAQQSTNQALFGLENLLVMWIGAHYVVDGSLSLGMLIAFMAYKTQFMSRASALIDKIAEFRLASVHLERMSDIALEPEEEGVSDSGTALVDFDGSLTVENLSFRYAESDPYVFEKISFNIAAGQCVGIVGPSGVGKTTLLKAMMGLLRPESGAILADGQDIHRAGLAAYRRNIAAVMQEDTLLSGTLADNIAFFDPTPDQERIRVCAKAAAIDDAIQRMPMGYLTLVGDMGAALSGGQKQRVLLARALYAQPKILFLDEATSHVDPTTEGAIHETLAAARMTRVIIAHRRETLAIVDRVISIPDLQGRNSPATNLAVHTTRLAS